MAVRVAVLDANVLYGIEVTDVLLTMATRRLYRPHWSPEILDEVARNLRLRRDLDPAAIDRRITQMNRALPGAAEAPPASLIDEMPVNDKDRHVLALAVHTGAPPTPALIAEYRALKEYWGITPFLETLLGEKLKDEG